MNGLPWLCTPGTRRVWRPDLVESAPRWYDVSPAGALFHRSLYPADCEPTSAAPTTCHETSPTNPTTCLFLAPACFPLYLFWPSRLVKTRSWPWPWFISHEGYVTRWRCHQLPLPSSQLSSSILKSFVSLINVCYGLHGRLPCLRTQQQTSLSCGRWTRATLCITPILL